MKKWPKDDSPVSFRELVEQIREAILFAFDIKRKNRNKNIPWEGYDIGEDSKVCWPSPNEKFRVKNMKCKEPLDVILGVLLQLGIEQGKRIFKTSTEYKLKELKQKIRMNSLKLKVRLAQEKK